MRRSTYPWQSRSSSISLWVCARSMESSGSPAFMTDSCMISKRILFVLEVSFPPLRIAQLPLLIHKVDIWTRASGLASKITPITPMGQVIRLRVRPSSSSRKRVVLPKGSLSEISWSIPLRQSFSLPSVNLSLFMTACEISLSSALSVSSLFAANILSAFALREPAISLRALFLSSIEDAAR